MRTFISFQPDARRHARTLRGAALAAALTATAALGAGAVAPAASDAAMARSYADGPVVYLTKSESAYLAAGVSGAAGAALGSVTGPQGAAIAMGAAVGIGTQYVNSQIARNRCLMVKVRYWNPQWTSVGFYSWNGVCR